MLYFVAQLHCTVILIQPMASDVLEKIWTEMQEMIICSELLAGGVETSRENCITIVVTFVSYEHMRFSTWVLAHWPKCAHQSTAHWCGMHIRYRSNSNKFY